MRVFDPFSDVFFDVFVYLFCVFEYLCIFGGRRGERHGGGLRVDEVNPGRGDFPAAGAKRAGCRAGSPCLWHGEAPLLRGGACPLTLLPYSKLLKWGLPTCKTSRWGELLERSSPGNITSSSYNSARSSRRCSSGGTFGRCHRSGHRRMRYSASDRGRRGSLSSFQSKNRRCCRRRWR